ncbi:MAG TPA: DUF192 domain-containing protein [Candidatus Brocadiia bacterium]|nr:DUF192 domain-containing protein [Candidatus Brocadiia bacterium]
MTPPEATHKLVIAQIGKDFITQLHEAETPWSRMAGLLGRTRMEPGEGMLFRRCRSIHTFFMRMPIDVVYLDASGLVVKIVPSLAPWRVSGCWRAADTLETGAGYAAAAGLRPGDRLTLSEMT